MKSRSVGFGFAIDLLQIHQLRDLWMHEDVMAAVDSRQTEAESLDQCNYSIQENKN